MKDHPALKDIYGRLRNKHNVIVFIDSEDDEYKQDAEAIMAWFEKITKDHLSPEDIILVNGTFLCIRKVLKNMPAIDPRTVGEYEVTVLDKETLKQIRKSQNEL